MTYIESTSCTRFTLIFIGVICDFPPLCPSALVQIRTTLELLLITLALEQMSHAVHSKTKTGVTLRRMLKQVPQNEAIHDLATTETDLKRPTDTVVKVAEHQ